MLYFATGITTNETEPELSVVPVIVVLRILVLSKLMPNKYETQSNEPNVVSTLFNVAFISVTGFPIQSLHMNLVTCVDEYETEPPP
jgi:hypothetical protein